MKHINRIMLLGPLATQAPFAEYDPEHRRWRVWQSFNPTVTEGTYLLLYENGLAERCTELHGRITEIVTITGPVE